LHELFTDCIKIYKAKLNHSHGFDADSVDLTRFQRDIQIFRYRNLTPQQGINIKYVTEMTK
jgi:hypothetical protein